MSHAGPVQLLHPFTDTTAGRMAPGSRPFAGLLHLYDLLILRFQGLGGAAKPHHPEPAACSKPW
jgi:hypothetical protein